MNIIKPSHKIIRYTEEGIQAIADAARTCYLSEPQDTPELRNKFIDEVVGWTDRGKQSRTWHISEFEEWTRNRFITKLRNMGHQTPFEFMDIEIDFICDRGVSHEAVRHRLASFMQESTRYVNYSEDGKHGMNVINPIFFDVNEERQTVDTKNIPVFCECFFSDTNAFINKLDVWHYAMLATEWSYNTLLDMGASPQEARSVLPNSLKTKLKIKANVREWFHIFQLRAINPGAHPQIKEIMLPALKECAERWPILFEWMLKNEK